MAIITVNNNMNQNLLSISPSLGLGHRSFLCTVNLGAGVQVGWGSIPHQAVSAQGITDL